MFLLLLERKHPPMVPRLRQKGLVSIRSVTIAMQIFVKTLTGRGKTATLDISFLTQLAMLNPRFRIEKGQIFGDCLVKWSIKMRHIMAAPARIYSVCPSTFLHCLVTLIHCDRSHFRWEAARRWSSSLGLQHREGVDSSSRLDIARSHSPCD
jgi:hypothetical protein